MISSIAASGDLECIEVEEGESIVEYLDSVKMVQERLLEGKITKEVDGKIYRAKLIRIEDFCDRVGIVVTKMRMLFFFRMEMISGKSLL